MSRPLLVLRPQPGADATAVRARALGFEAIVAPLFRILQRDWAMPERPVDAVLVTSANAARNIGEGLSQGLPVYAVGEATAAALREVGVERIVTGNRGVQDVVHMAEADGARVMLHLSGEDRTLFDPGTIYLETRTAYAAEPCDPGAAFMDALDRGAVALLHSARAARRFRELAGPGHRIAAISPAVTDAAGPGWSAVAVADRPTDDALLAAAARLCH